MVHSLDTASECIMALADFRTMERLNARSWRYAAVDPRAFDPPAEVVVDQQQQMGEQPVKEEAAEVFTLAAYRTLASGLVQLRRRESHGGEALTRRQLDGSLVALRSFFVGIQIDRKRIEKAMAATNGETKKEDVKIKKNTFRNPN